MELRQQGGVSKTKQERVSKGKQDDTAEVQVRQHLCVMQNVVQNHAQVSNKTGAKKGKECKTRCGTETKTKQKVNQQERKQIVTARGEGQATRYNEEREGER